MLVRSIIDESVFADERIFFESSAELGVGLVSKSPEPRIIPGDIVSSAVCNSITDIDRARNKKLVEEAKQAPEIIKKVNELRPQYIDKETTRVQKNTDLSQSDAKQVVLHALDNFELESGFPITLSDGTEHLVEEILNNPEKYKGETCLDPIEPDYDGGRVVGNIFVNENGSVVIHSFARGGRTFILKRGKVLNKVHKSWVQKKYDARKLEQSNVIEMCVSRALEYCMTIPEIELMLSECLDILSIKSKKTEYKKSIHERVANHREFEAIEKREEERAELQHEFDNGNYEPSDLLDKINLFLFPDIEFKKNGDVDVHKTEENLDHLLKSYGIKYSYDGIAKLPIVSFPGEDQLDAVRGNDGNSASTKIQIMESICCRNDIDDKLIGRIPALNAKYFTNSIQDYFDGLPPWDGETDNIGQVVEHMDVHSDYQEFASSAVIAWLIQGVAAADTGRHAKELYESNPSLYQKEPLPKYEGVLVLQGEQGASKTDFLTSLLPRKLRRYIKTGLTLDVNNKDSVKLAVSGFIVELGELDATFRAGDIARIKSFLSKMHDEFRLPYAPTENSYPRQTIFCASVNDEDFLVDPTGNRRFYTIKVGQLKMVPDEIINGAWAQAVSLYRSGSTWWLNEEQEKLQEALNSQHAMRNDYSESIDYYFKPGEPNDGDTIFVCVKVLQDIAHRGNVDTRRFGVALKTAGFETANPTVCVLSGERLRGRYIRLTKAGKHRVEQMVEVGTLDVSRALKVIQELNQCNVMLMDD